MFAKNIYGQQNRKKQTSLTLTKDAKTALCSENNKQSQECELDLEI